MKLTILTLLIGVCSSCQLLTSDRSFLDQMNYGEGEFFRPNTDFPVVGGDNYSESANPMEMAEKNTDE